MKIEINELEYFALRTISYHVMHEDDNINCEDCETCPLRVLEPVEQIPLGNEGEDLLRVRPHSKHD